MSNTPRCCLRLLLALSVGTLLVACSSGGSGGSDVAAPEAPTVDEITSSLAKAGCEKGDTCKLLPSGQTVDQCITSRSSDLKAGVEAATKKKECARADLDRCHTLLKDAACDQIASKMAECSCVGTANEDVGGDVPASDD